MKAQNTAVLKRCQWTYQQCALISYPPHHDEGITKVFVALSSPIVYVRVHYFGYLIHKRKYFVAEYVK